MYLKKTLNHCYGKKRKQSSKTTDSHKTYQSNVDDRRKHHLKYFCLKCNIWWEINKTTFLFGVYSSVSFLFICFELMSSKMCDRFFIFFLIITQFANQSQTSTGLSVYVIVEYIKFLPSLSPTVSLAKNNFVMFL